MIVIPAVLVATTKEGKLWIILVDGDLASERARGFNSPEAGEALRR